MFRFSPFKAIAVFIVCLIAIFCSLPNFISESKKEAKPYSYLPDSKVNLGLDLRGGAHLLLQVNFDYYIKEQLGNLSEGLKKDFIEAGLNSFVETESDKVVFTFAKDEYVSKAKKLIRKFDPEINIDGSSNKIFLSYSDSSLVKMRQNLIKQSIEIVRRRIDETGTKEPIIQAQGNNRILLQVPGIHNPQEIKDLLGKTAKLTFHLVNDISLDGNFSNHGLNYNSIRIQDGEGRNYLIEKDPMLTGDLLIDANATYYEGQPAVAFKFNHVGATKFATITTHNVGRIFAIVLDGKIITAPKINSVITGGAGVISGSFNIDEANNLALLLRAGALPAPIDIIEERTIGPSLGADSIRYGTTAALYGFIMVAAFMFIFYGSLGMIANFALVINIAMILTFLSWLGATLTLPGIAGIVLTMGMSVDANVLIFERMKEESRTGSKKVISVIDAGFSQAFRTILDSNITTLIIAFILYAFGSGAVRGFAVTLTIGILSSMFSAIILTRTMIALWVKYRRLPLQSLPI
ncbi:MAG: secD [Rickettsiaceae bacterium]|jgi:preprotein translocase subunit SecD|nr:secD [Rickettsiaceae bacterium]